MSLSSRDKFRILIRYILGFPKSLYFNFRMLPFKQAIYIPILISHKTRIQHLSGTILLTSEIMKTGVVKIGFGHTQICDFRSNHTIIDIQGKIFFQGKCKIGIGCHIYVTETGCLTFGSNFNVTSNSNIICNNTISFGNNNLLSWHCLIMDTDQHAIYDSITHKMLNEDRAIIFGDNVWCGCNCILLKGTRIGNQVVIAAGSRLSSKYPYNNVVLSGNPAIVYRQNIYWK